MSLVTLPRTVRTFTRLRVIAQVLSRHGFGHFVDRLQLGRYLPSADWFRRGKKLKVPETDPLVAVGQRLVRVCEELGPTWIKLGQVASTRPDILPAALLGELEKLQDDVRAFPAEQARRIFQQDTGTSVDEAFESFTDEPLASGSIAQVHRARTRDGEDVIVKVKRPGIEQVVQLDIYVLEWMADRAEALFPELRPYRPKLLVDEFAQSIRRELDFINEASATSRFFEAFKENPHIITPHIRWDLTSTSVLTMQYLEGIHLRDAIDGRSAQCDRKALAHHLAECFLEQFFELGFFHADPHPGNLLVAPPDKIILYDFGMFGQIDDKMVGQLVISIVAMIRREVDVLVDVLADFGAMGEATNRDLLTRDMRDMLEKYYGLPLRRLDLRVIFRELLEIVRRNDVVLPRDFVAMFKSLATVSGAVMQLDPEMNLVSLIQPKLSGLLRDRFAPRRLYRQLGISGWHVATILRDAPRQIRDLIRGAARGNFQINIRHENLDYLASEMDRSSNRLAFSVLVAATIVGSSMLLSMEQNVEVLGVPIRYLGFVGYAIAVFMAVALLYAIIRSGKMS